MRILGAGIIRDYSGNIMNIHPSLLPAFPGLNAQKQAILYGVKVSGCTVHFVDEGTDTGPVILQRCVPVADDDDEESLAKRILSEEHRAFPEAIALFLPGPPEDKKQDCHHTPRCRARDDRRLPLICGIKNVSKMERKLPGKESGSSSISLKNGFILI